ncbi:MAG: hypothetical protein FJW38_24330 [Acidobacteria bacterium]|nr:hypothetical protein [Acidobacteriota bacterium]
MPRGNPSPKLAITVDPEIHKGVLRAAKREKVSVSAWMTEAARNALRLKAGLAGVAAWEREHGRSTEAEKEEAQRRVMAQLFTPVKVRRTA